MSDIRRLAGMLGATMVLALTAVAAGCAAEGDDSGGSGDSKDPVLLGLLGHLTGQQAVYGPPTVNAAKLAVSELNKDGGVLRRKVELELADVAGDPKQAALEAQRLVGKEQVDALVATIDSASREAMMPSVQRSGVPFIYTSLYEGAACDEHMYATGSVAETLKPVLQYVNRELPGKTWYLVGNDYLYPQNTNKAAAETIEADGGSVVGQDLFALGTSDFSQVLDKIKREKPANVFMTLVGADAVAFVKQAHSFGLSDTTRIVTPVIFDDQLPGLEPAVEGMYGVLEWSPQLDDPATKKFLAAYESMFGADAPVPNQLSENIYNAVKIWAKAVEKAGTTDHAAVLDALAGITFEDAPRGPVTLESDTHHVAMPMYLMKANGKGTYDLVKRFDSVSPGAQCDF